MATETGAPATQPPQGPPPNDTILVAVPTSGFIPGLEPLLPLNQIFMKQSIDILEVVIGFEQSNRYTFFAPNGQMVYLGDEDSNCCLRQYCGSSRPFQLHIRDPNGNGILLDRPCFCCLATMDVFAISSGELLGRIAQQCVCSWFQGERFNVFDDVGNLIFIIKSPYCTLACCGNVTFDLVSPGDMQTPIGKITKTWAGFGQEMFTEADNFGISFPGDLSVKIKAVLLGAAVLIDFMFYEKNQQSRSY